MGLIGGIVTEGGVPVSGRVVRAYRRDTGALIGQAITADGIAELPGDPHWASVVSLLTYDAVGFIDLCGWEWDVFGSAASGVDAGIVGGSGVFPLAASRIRRTGVTVSGEITIETRYLHAAGNALRCIFRAGDVFSEAWGIYVDELNRIRLYGSASWLYTGGAALVDGQVYHLEVGYTASTGTATLFLNGALVASVSGATLVGTKSLNWGGDIYNQGLRSYLDNSRITFGVRRHTSAFTPPALGPLPSGPTGIVPLVGTYSINTGAFSGEVQVVCLDGAGGATLNDLITRSAPV